MPQEYTLPLLQAFNNLSLLSSSPIRPLADLGGSSPFKTMNNSQPAGFASIKLLILGVILAVGLASLFLAFLAGRNAAKDKQRLTDVAVMAQALAIFSKENGFYPYGSNLAVPTGIENYVDHWPVSPEADGTCSPVQNAYTYSQKSSGADFTLSFCLGQSVGSLSAGSHVLTAKGIQ